MRSTRIALAQLDGERVVVMLRVRGETCVSLERCVIINGVQVNRRSEGHIGRGAGGNGTGEVLRDRRVVVKLVGHREVGSGLGTIVADGHCHRLIGRIGWIGSGRSRDGHHTHIVLRHRGVDDDERTRRFTGVVELELGVPTIVDQREGRGGCRGQRRVAILLQHLLLVVRRIGAVLELGLRNAHTRHTAGGTTVVLRVDIQGTARIVEAARHRNGHPARLVKRHLTVEHQLRVRDLVVPNECRRSRQAQCVRTVLHPNLDRNGDTGGVGCGQVDEEGVDGTGDTAHLTAAIQNLGIRVAIGHIEGCRLCRGLRTSLNSVHKVVRLDTAAIVEGARAENRIRGVARALTKDIIAGVLSIEIEIVQRGGAGRHRHGVTIGCGKSDRCRSHRIGRHVQHTTDGVVVAIDRHIARWIAVDMVVVCIVAGGRTQVVHRDLHRGSVQVVDGS